MGAGTALAEIFINLPKTEKEAALIKMRGDRDFKELEVEWRYGVSSTNNSSATAPHGEVSKPGPVHSQSLTPRERGKSTRSRYFEQLREEGINLNSQGCVFAATLDGQRVALPFARERNPNAWFLGLPEDELRKPDLAVVLL